MCKTHLQQFFSTAMALLLLFSTVSFTVEKHFCGDELIAVAVFGKVEKCAMEALETEREQLTKVPCCKDTLEVVSGLNQLNNNPFHNWNVDQQQCLIAFIYAYNSLYVTLQSERCLQIDYQPPNLIIDRQVLGQVYII
jgi:hypothetical protein